MTVPNLERSCIRTNDEVLSISYQMQFWQGNYWPKKDRLILGYFIAICCCCMLLLYAILYILFYCCLSIIFIPCYSLGISVHVKNYDTYYLTAFNSFTNDDVIRFFLKQCTSLHIPGFANLQFFFCVKSSGITLSCTCRAKRNIIGYTQRLFRH